MNIKNFPTLIQNLPEYKGQFDAHRLTADGCDVLFAAYPANTNIPAHAHDTENCGVITKGELILTSDGVESRYAVGDWYHVAPDQMHSARFEVETTEIEFWFKV